MGVKIEYKTKIINLISAMNPNLKIYLFGSRAVDQESGGSDIDIALDAGHRMEIVDVGEIRDILNATHIPHKIDVVDLNFVPEKMRAIILKEGILWKS